MNQAQPCCTRLSRYLSPRFFKALGDPTRVALLNRLAETGGELTVSELAKDSPIDISVVSRHLAMLRDAGILEARKRGKEVFYRICIGPLAALLRGLADALESCCPPSTGGAEIKDSANREQEVSP